jgi:hypothetical protein
MVFADGLLFHWYNKLDPRIPSIPGRADRGQVAPPGHPRGGIGHGRMSECSSTWCLVT